MAISEDDIEALTIHRQVVEGRQAQLDTATSNRDDFIRELLGKGAMPTEIGRIVGLSRARVNQIKERRR